ncbi:MAG TPA: AMP-binding protein [Burkholderiales bacterium]|jgi:acyl-coenzyme A synthetase/AMP-(fatty) acid ligase
MVSASRAAFFPLLAGFGAHGRIGWSGGAAVTAAQFCATVLELAGRLPPKGQVINLCTDRLHFLVGFAAALIARQTTLLPQSSAPGALRELQAAHPGSYCLADDASLPAGLPAIVVPPWRPVGDGLDIPPVPGSHVALVAFTSGSTGRPQPHARTWGSLVTAARLLGKRLGIAPQARCTIVGTVPPQHVYGLETTVMLPLQNGAAVDAGRPLLPGDIAAALEALPEPRWLATTPAHLRACVESGAAQPRLAGIVSATMPLSAELAARAERLWSAPLHEIYGCTETGAIALRRTAGSERWRATDGLRLRQRGEATWAEGAQLAAPTRLPDRIEVSGESEFVLLGRPEDLVKVAGKRASLEQLNRELAAVPGVHDGVFFVPESARAVARLAALAVAPGRDAAAILAALRGRIDPAFLPRPLLIVDALPRNAAGKLPREALLALAKAAARRRSA